MASTSRRSNQGSGSSDQDAGAVSSTPPDAALGVWLSWMKGHMGPAGGPGLAVPGEHWLMGPDAAAGKMLSAGTEQLRTMLAGDPLLCRDRPDVERQPAPRRHPGRLGRGGQSAAHGLAALAGRPRPGHHRGRRAERQGLERGHRSLEQRRQPLARPGQATTRSGLGAGDKRFEAPEWHNNPAYRTLKDMYLLASDFLLNEVEAGGLRASRAGAAALPPAAVRQRHEPDAPPALQPRGPAPGHGDRRCQPRRRRAQPPGRPQGGPAQHGRRRRPSSPGATSPSRRARWSSATG